MAGFWPYRLVVRTPGSHPGNRGSIPRTATILRSQIIRSLGEEGLVDKASAIILERATNGRPKFLWQKLKIRKIKL